MTPETLSAIADGGQTVAVLVVVWWFRGIIANHMSTNTKATLHLSETISRLNGKLDSIDRR